MYCPSCGHQNESDAKFCKNCGIPIAHARQETEGTEAPTSQVFQEPGRGGLILTFGILSLILLGPILGIPAWVMGRRDMKKIRAGSIEMSSKGLTKTGMVLGIIGTFISTFTIIMLGIVIAVAFTMFKTDAQVANRDQLISHLDKLGAKAQTYLGTPSVMGGGAASFAGFRLSDVEASDANGIYQIAERIPTVPSYYKPSANHPARNANSLVIVGWGDETGNDGIHKVEACVTVTPREIYATVIN